ncbi:hypothetical protein [Rhodopila sp.]|uniref:hypothetical protein n=1 Tax=Rhodopila sp. TaxID=2480087 RepID=UPI003D0FA73F
MQPWTYAALKTAVAALSPVPATLDLVVAAINAQSTTLTSQTFPWSAAKLIARQASTGDWSRIVARARGTPALPPASTADQAILAAINAVESLDSDIIDPTNAPTWAAFQAGLAALGPSGPGGIGSGDISAATIAAITALTTVTGPAWVPAVTAGQVQTAEAQP